MTRRQIVLSTAATTVLAGVGTWWHLRDRRIPAIEFYDPTAFPEFELTFNGVPLDKTLIWEEYWVIVARSLPPARFPNSRFSCLLTFHRFGDDAESLGFTVLEQQYDSGPNITLQGLEDGKAVDVTPPMASPGDPRIQLCGLMHPAQAFTDKGASEVSVIGIPLTVWVWVYPLKESGEPRFSEGVLVRRHDIEIKLAS